AFEAIKSVRSEINVGWSLALIDLQAIDGGEERTIAARRAAQLDWLDVSAADDFIGVQTYSRERIGADGMLPRPDGPVTQTGWEIYPQALEHSIRLAAHHAKVPIVVTENGMATDDDAARIAYTTAALQGLERCIDDGIDVRGYTHWTLLDNFEWTAGFGPKFGLIAVDRETFERTPKPSLAWLGDYARASRSH
ncbi:MAG: glycoside hydrolase family 1, partial [Ilumatobacteraceae bacterium]|nr:glycoside hydrolase family 1 [Ilumatobacteraceae bacterium]